MAGKGQASWANFEDSPRLRAAFISCVYDNSTELHLTSMTPADHQSDVKVNQCSKSARLHAVLWRKVGLLVADPAPRFCAKDYS